MWPFGRPTPSGPHGEHLARRHLRRSGLKILARNYRCPAGEIDLIALDRRPAEGGGATLAFVEVKTRRDDALTDPSSAVDADKRRRIRKAAAYYLAQRDSSGYNVRFDIVSVVLGEAGPPQVRHIPDAFR